MKLDFKVVHPSSLVEKIMKIIVSADLMCFLFNLSSKTCERIYFSFGKEAIEIWFSLAPHRCLIVNHFVLISAFVTMTFLKDSGLDLRPICGCTQAHQAVISFKVS